LLVVNSKELLHELLGAVQLKTDLIVFGNHVSIAHDGAVMGVHVDIENRMMISAGKDSYLKFWNFSTKEFVSSLTLESFPTKSLLHRER